MYHTHSINTSMRGCCACSTPTPLTHQCVGVVHVAHPLHSHTFLKDIINIMESIVLLLKLSVMEYE